MMNVNPTSMTMNAAQLHKIINDPFLSPATLAQALWPSGNNKWIPAKYLVFLSKIIALELMKGGARLIISLPPRHGKSTLISQVTIPWYLNKFPNNDVLLASYNKDQATEFGRKARDIIKEHDNLFSINIRKDVKRADKFYTVQGSETNFIGLEGSATGKGSHLLVIDDFIKNLTEASSTSYKDKMYAGYISNLRTRLENDIYRNRKGSIIILATRWWSDDLIGRILAKDLGVGDWKYISLPAIAEKNDVMGRAVGEPLFPEKYDIDDLMKMKQDFGGDFMWSSLFQQNPINDLTGLTDGDWVQKIYPLPTEHEKTLDKVRFWDLAATEGGGDDTATCLMGRDRKTDISYVMSMATNKYSVPKVEKWIKDTAERDKRIYGKVKILIEEEPGSSGKHLVHHMATKVLQGFDVQGVPTRGKSKVVRAQPMIGATELGKILYYIGNWNAKFIDQFGSFTGDSNGIDDMVDVTSGSYNYLNDDISSPVIMRQGGAMSSVNVFSPYIDTSMANDNYKWVDVDRNIFK